jgi:hypothetical protein
MDVDGAVMINPWAALRGRDKRRHNYGAGMPISAKVGDFERRAFGDHLATLRSSRCFA